MTRTNNRQARHMSQSATRNGGKRRGAVVVALAIAGVLAVGGVSAVCVAGLGKSPGQAPAAAQTASAQKAAPAKAATPTKATPAKATPAKAETQQAAKAEAQPAQKQQAQPAKQAAAQPAKQQAKPQQAKPQAAPAPRQAEQSSGLEARVSREQCINVALAHVGAGGQAKGEAQNVTAKGPITGGGTVYYAVELDLGDVHYSVTVDAIGGNVISSDQTHAGTRALLDESGNPIDGTEQPVSA